MQAILQKKGYTMAKYLEGKDIVINACRAGISDGLVGRMAEQTGVTIYASKHKVFAGYKYNGKKHHI